MSHLRPEHRLLLLTMLPRPEGLATAEIRRLVGLGVDWEYTVRAAERLATVQVLSAALDHVGVSLPRDIERRCQAARVAGAARALLAERRLMELHAVLEEAATPFLVLKGLPLAHELYGETGLRPGSDLDVLVRRSDRDRALSTLGRLGYRLPSGSFSMHFYRAHHFHAMLVRERNGGIPVELHWDTQPFISRSRIPEGEFWERVRMVTLGALRVRVPGREENFLYLVQHLARHALGLDASLMANPVDALLSPVVRGRLIWLSDLALLARSRPALDWELAARLAKRWGLHAELEAALEIIRRLDTLPLDGRRHSAPRHVAGEAATSRTRLAASSFPGLARTSPSLHLRPILIFEGLRHAFPGARWIRWRYGLSQSTPPEVAFRAVLHATRVLLDLGRMFQAAVWETVKLKVRRGRAVGPRRNEITRMGREIYPSEALQSSVARSKLKALKTN